MLTNKESLVFYWGLQIIVSLLPRFSYCVKTKTAILKEEDILSFL